jgi:hypothetical protein
VRWGYLIEPVGPDRSSLSESWEFLPAGRDMFHEKYGEGADERIELRRGQALRGIPATLAAIKRVAEDG